MNSKLSHPFALLSILVISTFISFFPCLFNNFTQWDDPMFVVKNESIRDLSVQGISKIFGTMTDAGYIPLTILTFAIEYHFFQLSPFVYHLNNFIIHILNVLLVFWFMRLIEPRLMFAFLTALLFAIHPMRVESVAWVTERKDLLFCFFYLSGLITYTKSLLKTSDQRPLYWMTWLFFALSMISKPQAMTFPFVLLAIDFLFERKNFKSCFIEKLPFLVLLIAFVVINIIALAPVSNTQAFTGTFNLIEKTLLTGHAFAVYIFRSIFPLNLSCVYPYPAVTDHFFPPSVYISFLFTLSIAFLIYKFFRHDRKVLFAVIFMGMTIGVTFLTIWYYEGYYTQDHFSYLFHIGFFYALILVTHKIMLNSRLSPIFLKWRTILLVITSGFYIIMSISYCIVWKNNITLWSNVIDHYPSLALAYSNRGATYMQIGAVSLALNDLNNAVRLDPKHTNAIFNRALLFTDTGEYEKAIFDYTTIIELDSKHVESYNNRGYIYFSENNLAQAINDFTQALNIDPNYEQARLNRAQCYMQLQDYKNAYMDATYILKSKPDHQAAKELYQVIEQYSRES